MEAASVEKAIGTSGTLHCYALLLSLFAFIVGLSLGFDESEERLMTKISNSDPASEEQVILKTELDAHRTQTDRFQVWWGLLAAVCIFLWLIAPLPAWNRLVWLRHLADPTKTWKTVALAVTIPLAFLVALSMALSHSPKGLGYSAERQTAIAVILVLGLGTFWHLKRWWRRQDDIPLRLSRWQSLGGLLILSLSAIGASSALLESVVVSQTRMRESWNTNFLPPLPDSSAILAKLTSVEMKLESVAAAQSVVGDDEEMKEHLETKQLAFETQRQQLCRELEVAKSRHRQRTGSSLPMFRSQTADWDNLRISAALAGLLALSGWLVYLWRPQNSHEV